MLLRLLLFIALLVPGPHWVRVRASLSPRHFRWLNRMDNILGEYYLSPGMPETFTAQCYVGKQTIFATEAEARAFVQTCEVW